MVESVKCLCNLVLNNNHLVNVVSELGCLSALKARLTLSTTSALPYDISFFDLRLLFLITACGPEQRSEFNLEARGQGLT